jgi:hypothetical protein
MAESATVPHPLHTYLVNLQRSVRAVQQKMSGKLDRPATNFAAGNVWVGPTADSWGTQLNLKHLAYKNDLARLDAVVSAKLATTPATCTPDEAQVWERRLRHA